MQTTRTFSFNNQNRPDRLKDGNLPGGERSADRWFDPTAFAAPPDFKLGNAGRNVLRAPGSFVMDWSLSKRFPIGETRDLQFRAEFFNLPNVVNLGPPVAFVGNPNLGKILSAGPARQVQFGLRLQF